MIIADAQIKIIVGGEGGSGMSDKLRFMDGTCRDRQIADDSFALILTDNNLAGSGDLVVA